MPKPWPRLTEQLAGPRSPALCQSCGDCCDLDRWREHDDADRPEARVLVLCLRCSNRLIEPHPRLYGSLDRNQPWPGCMQICVACRHRDGVGCTHPDLKANGGAGLKIMVPNPTSGFIDGTDKAGRRWGHPFRSYPHEPRECAGRQTADVVSLADHGGPP